MDALEGLLKGVSWELGAVTAAAMVFVVAAASALRAMLAGRHEVVERIERTVGRADEPLGRHAREGGFEMGRFLRPVAWLARPTRAAELGRLRSRLVQGGYRGAFALEKFLAIKILLAAGATGAFLALNARLGNQRLAFPLDMGAAVWLCGVFFFLPNFWLAGKISERQGVIERALPDAMDLLVTCVESGLGIDAAISRVSQEIGLASPLLGDELNLTFLEVQAGIPRVDAFRRLADRTGVEDLRALSAMLVQTEMFGTSVARALRVHGEGMRTKRMQRAEEKAAMVGVKMTIPLVLCILPSLVAILLGPAIVSIAQVLFPNLAGKP